MRDLSIKKKVRHLIFTLYALMGLTLLGSLSLALYQNWQLKLQSSRSEMARQAGIGNFIIEHAVINAIKALNTAQQSLQKTLATGAHLSMLQAHEVLQQCLSEHNAYTNSDYKGLMLYIDAQGLLQARTDRYPAERFDFSSRVYFHQLQQSPNANFAIGPLLKAQTTGEWVFHVSVPLRDAGNAFRGVLAQQIRLSDINQDLARYIDNSHPTQIVIQSLDGHLSLVHPPGLLAQLVNGSKPSLDTSYADFARRSTTPQDSFFWPPEPGSQQKKLLVGYEVSEHFKLLTTAHRSIANIQGEFISESLFLIGISAGALLLLTFMVFRLSRVYDQFSDALHDSFSDTLTQLPNRRAMQDLLPRLLRDGIRTQQPMSVLFIDIDHFKNFNDDYGHDGGDIALSAVAQALQACTKRPLDFVCRWGGEEFVAILPHTALQAATQIAEAALQAVRQLTLRDTHGNPMRSVSVSIGIASATVVSHETGEHLIAAADEAMQSAKKAGRDRYELAQSTKS